MKVLDLRDVGVISLVQSIVMIVSFSQIGLLNGAYRLISKSESHLKRINDFIFSYNFYLLCIIIILVYPICLLLNIKDQLMILIYSSIAGIISIVSNWMSNLLIANQKIALLNRVNLISSFASFLSLLLVKYSSLWAGILLVTSQPFIIVAYAIIIGKYEISISSLNKRTFNYIFSVGFIPYLINIIGSLFLLIEKWLITLDLGVHFLGKYYLVGMYSTFFLLVPSALNNLEFSKSIRSFSSNLTYAQILISFKSYFLKLLIYIILAGLLSYFLAPFVIGLILPKYLESVYLIRIVYWGLASLTLVQPIILVIQIKFQYKSMLSIYIGSILLTLLVYYMFTFNFSTNLTNYAYINLFFNLLVSALFCGVYLLKESRIKLKFF
jgi:O-antigen/teichoic acid export membrane protein